MPVLCSHCHKYQANPLRCSACHVAVYCSKDCQKKHWKSHKGQCKKIQTKVDTSSQPNKTLNGFSNKSSKPNTAETSSHPDATNSKSKNNDAQAGSFPDITKNSKECGNCKIIAANMKSCGGCSQVFYCSRACQKEDWSIHKKECSHLDGSIETKEFKKQKNEEVRRQAKRERQSHDVPFELENLMRSFGIRSEQEMSNVPPKPCMSITEARKLTRRLLKCVEIIENLSEIPQELLFSTPREVSAVLLATISRFHEYGSRHAVYIEDSHGQETFVMFYLDHDFPEPFFHWNQVVPGNFLVLRGPFFHHFLDGTVGIRINDACDVMIIHKGLKTK